MGTSLRSRRENVPQGTTHLYNGSTTTSSLATSQGTSEKSDTMGTNSIPRNSTIGRMETLQFLYTRLSRVISEQWNCFFYSPCKYGKELGGMFRIAFAFIMLKNYCMLGMDYAFFFLPSRGLLPLEFARQTVDFKSTWTLFSFIPQTDTWYWTVYYGLLLHILLLGCGITPRLNALCVFLWHSSFVCHNSLLWNGEDCVMKLYAFLMIFLPLDHYTIWSVLDRFKNNKTSTNNKQACTRHRRQNQRREQEDASPSMWPFRLIQLQLCFIYVSTVILKWTSQDWQSGHALYYVVQLDDMYGGFFNPQLLFGYLGTLKLLTYGSLLLETVAPILLWFDSCRILTLVAVILFHVSINASMNLNCFHSIMILGWLSFLAQPNRKDGKR